MQQRVFVIHGWDSSPEDAWFPWLRTALASHDVEVIIPAMPEPLAPTIEGWVGHVREVVGEVRSTDIFIGHSVGCQTILRYLETIPEQTVAGVICVAGWFALNGLETEEEKYIARPWLETPIDLAVVRRRAGHVTAILSDNDPYSELASTRAVFASQLGADVIVEPGKGHFSIEHGEVRELPIVRDTVLKLLS